MPATVENRLIKVLIEMVENPKLSTKERMAAIKQLAEIRKLIPVRKHKPKQDKGLLG